ncbi:DNA alkylation repair protein [Lysinibacillus sp. G4S2]|uniref:DNA alkylation repair protein n=1 Tax=Lysinibacillus sp. G4S2 TaxID=3055859 RepID=UPI0025A03670|nr:DNA alkylation repair protein [Lysinibacillus sp. G4S2]MDM5248006.1 DNA alkylation repair protein [Lysinibacillus sp. G4S2]
MVVKEDILNRKGARKASDIPNDVLMLLNQGEIESVNLMEWQAVNHISLVKNVLPTIGLEEKLEFVLTEIEKQKVETGMKAIRLIGSLLDTVMIDESATKKEDVIKVCSQHVSDSVRCWAAFMNKNNDYSLEEKLLYIRPFAADHHFGVREIAWMSIREDLSANIENSVDLLAEWAKSEDENIRRFSLESIRPRGVWTKHIERLKEEPQIVLPILHLLKSDSSKYVQDSVGNWLNDASKTQPEWVKNLCDEWQKESPTKATERIIKKAQRTIVKGK